MTRLLQVEDLPSVVHLCHPLIAASTHPGRHINPTFFVSLWTRLLNEGSGLIAGCFDPELGLIAVSAMVVCHDLLTGIPHAQQVLVGVHPAKHGMGLRSVLDLAESEAYARGARYLAVTRATETEGGPRMDRFYKSRGYRPVQITLLNDLCLSSPQPQL